MKTTIHFLLVLLPACLQATTKTTTVSGNWSNPSIWSPSGVPASSDKVRLFHDVTLDINFTAADTVFVYSSLSISKNKTLALSPGTMILVNNSNYNGRLGSMGLKAAITGNYEFQRYIQRCDGYSLYGTPFTTAVSNVDWYYCNQCMPNWSNVYRYNETVTGTLDQGYSDQLNGTYTRGQGFFYWFQNYNGGKNFPRTISVNGSTDFTQDFDFNITYTKDSGPGNDGFNLLANPFPGTIDWMSSDWSKKKINNAVYIWNSCTGSYASFAGGVGVNGGSRYIPAMQGFWVQSNAAGPELKIASGAMVPDAAQQLRTKSDSVLALLRITLGEDEIAVRLDDSSHSGFDSENDALVMLSETSRLYSSVDSLDFAINTLGSGEQCVGLRTRGGGKMRFSGISSFPSSYRIFLMDRQNNTVTEITGNDEYVFDDTTTVTYAQRFELCFTSQVIKQLTTGIEKQETENFTIATLSDRFVLTLNNSMAEGIVTVCTLNGQLVHTGVTTQHVFTIPSAHEPLLVRVSVGDKHWFTKISR